MAQADNEEDIARRVMAKVLDRIASDPGFRQQLLDNPSVSLEATGMSQEAEELRSASGESADEVAGYAVRKPPGCGSKITVLCHRPSCVKTDIVIGIHA